MENSSEIKDQVVKNGLWNLLGSLINRGGGFVLIILLSRLLMPEGFGKYSLVMTISLFFITFSDLGISQTLIRYVSLGIDKKNNESASYFKYLLKLKFILTSLVSFLLLLIAYPLSFFLFKDPSLFNLILIISFYVFFTAITGFFESLFFIKKYVRYISIKEFISLFFKLIMILFISFFVSTSFKLTSIFISFVAVSLFSFLFVFYFSRKIYPSLFNSPNVQLNKKGIFRFLFFLNLQNISTIVLSQASIIILGIFVANEFIGYYQAAWALVIGITSLLFSSFSYTLLPIFTKLENPRFSIILKKAFNLFFIFALPTSFGLSILSRYFILVIYGYDYLPSSTSLSILAFLIIPIISIELILASLSAKNKLKRFSIAMVISMIFFIALNFLFISLFSFSNYSIILGVSFANLIGWSLCAFFAFYFLKKELNVRVISLNLIKPLLSCFIMYILIYFLLKVFVDINLISGTIIVVYAILVYFLSLFCLKGIGREEFNFFKLIFNFKKKNTISIQKNINPSTSNI